MKLYDYNREELRALMQTLGQPAYRADQVFQWCAKGAVPHEMTNLPASLIQTLGEMGTGGVVMQQRTASKDGSEKFLFVCEDGNAVEGVLMQYHHGASLCLSTQVGCRMGCKFCASGENGLTRNLTVGELCGQLYAVARTTRQHISNIVLMGCGEPLDNYENVVKFLRMIADEKGMHLSLRGVSLSTCGLVEKIDALSLEGLPVTLCISLHAADDETRKRILPIANRYTIQDVVDAARRYDQNTGRRVIFEYALVKGVNDGLQDAYKLAQLTANMRRHINLIPMNGDLNGMGAPPASQVSAFKRALEQKGVSVTVRRTLGADVEGACGQLRKRYMKGAR